MGTSVDQIDKTYGHLLPDSLDRTRAALDAFLSNAVAEAEDGSVQDRLGHYWATKLTGSAHRIGRESPCLRGFPAVGAPRFELGTSSPPDYSATWRGFGRGGATWLGSVG